MKKYIIANKIYILIVYLLMKITYDNYKLQFIFI